MSVLRLVPESGEPLEFAAELTVVGRDTTVCDVLVADGSVSRKHAVIERRPTSWVIVDQGSANGTWIEDRRINKAVLLHGHKLRLGAVKFSVVIEERTVAAPPAPVAHAPAPRSLPTMPFAPNIASAGAGSGTGPVAAGSGPGAPSAPGRMSAQEAASVLGVAPGATPDEIRRRYQKFYNEMQVRLTNAPTPALKRMYQKSLTDARQAAETLCPGIAL
ncbi:MAG: FHA domain-containing protein [Vicinamibacteria bacterium]|jgi:predicted component of type VI protein secretion system|nr:FHA domain-containing protein [Vicinamibacteria bacterium]